MDLVIRKMNLADVVSIYELGFGQEEFSSQSGSFWDKEQLKRWCQSIDDLMLVAEIAGEIVGFSFYSIHVPTGKVVWENIYIKPSNRKSGVAFSLAKEGLAVLRRMGYSYIVAHIKAKDKKQFFSFVEKLGFKAGPEMIWVDRLL